MARFRFRLTIRIALPQVSCSHKLFSDYNVDRISEFMDIHINTYTRSHLTKTVEDLRSRLVAAGDAAYPPASSIINIYDALIETLKICRLEAGYRRYIETMLSPDFRIDSSLEDLIRRQQAKIRDDRQTRYSVDFPLRSLYAALKHGEPVYPPDTRSRFEKLLGLNKPSPRELFEREERLFEPVALKLREIVEHYYRRRFQ